MVLNDPPIQIGVESWEQRQSKELLYEKYEFWMYAKNDYYLLDGFANEGLPCIVILPPPYR